MSRKSRAQRSTRPAEAKAGSASAEAVAASEPSAAPDSATSDSAPASMRDAMRAALDAKAARGGGTPGSGPRDGSNGPAGRGGGAKGFRALPRRSAG